MTALKGLPEITWFGVGGLAFAGMANFLRGEWTDGLQWLAIDLIWLVVQVNQARKDQQ